MKRFFRKNIAAEEIQTTSSNEHDWAQSFVDYSSHPIFRANDNGKLLYANQAFAKSLHYLSKADVEQKNLKEDLFASTESWDLFISQLQKYDRLENFEVEFIQKNNDKEIFRLDIRKIKNSTKQPIVFEGIIAKQLESDEKYNSLLTELQELKEKEKSASSQINKAVYTKNVKSQYLANMTHEIKTPINSIVGFLTLIEQNLFESEEELHDFAKNARISADSLLELINNILDISRLEADKMELDEVEFSLVNEIEKAKSIALPATSNKQIDVKTYISDDLKMILVGDPLRYRQVLMNILTNSVKYTETGSIDISVNIEKERELSYLVKTTVKDTGIGIPKEKLSLLFKPYTQVKAKKWNKQDGSGLGLMICKELVRLMDGEIIIKSKEGVGTIVEFTASLKLPEALKKYDNNSLNMEQPGKSKLTAFEKAALNAVDENKAPVNPKPINGNRNTEVTKPTSDIVNNEVNSSDFKEEKHSDVKRILLVEDNPISQKVELKLLKESGYSVEAVSNGFDAVEAIKTNSFNLVLMDVEMAEMDGLESTKKIRALEAPTNKIPIIAVTAHSSMKDREKCLASGMDDYIAKPININFMKMTIDHWLLKEMEI